MKKQQTSNHHYVLNNGEIVSDQREGCIKLGIGRNAFRNRVKSGVIKKVTTNDKPNGYNEKAITSALR